jgi:hypothetical protein
MMADPHRALWRAAALAGALAACSGEESGAGGADATTTGSNAGGAGGAGTGSSSSGGGQAPLICMDVYTDAPSGDCDLLQQDCPPGRTCAPIEFSGVWTTKCLSGGGLKGPGKACFDQGECAAGLFCIGEANSFCSPICCPGTGEPCGGGLCNANVAFGPFYAMMCTFEPECELFEQDACEGVGECHISDVTQGLATCAEPAPSQSDEGGPCQFINGCKDMQHCFEGTCRYYCLTNPPGALPPGQGGCPDTQGCASINLGVSGVGVCQPR